MKEEREKWDGHSEERKLMAGWDYFLHMLEMREAWIHCYLV